MRSSRLGVWLAAVCVACLSATTAEAQLPPRCDSLSSKPLTVPKYGLHGDSAHFVVTYRGNVTFRPEMPVDEDDRVTVHVLTPPELAPLLRVRRRSAFRPVGVINIAGDVAAALGAAIMTESKEGDPCDFRIVLTDFAPGRGEVEIAMVPGAGNPTGEAELGAFDFSVNPLYTGAFTLGPVRSELENPRFELITTAGGVVPTQTEVGSFRVFYTLFYTPFVWGKRDLEKPAKHFLHRINPSIGVTLNDMGENAMAGITVDLPVGVFLSWGIHAGKVAELDPRSGAKLGAPYSGTSVPTRRLWRSKPYAGVTVDLRVMLRLVKAATSTTL